MTDFYRMDPAAWDFGTAELSLEEEAAYLRIVNAIHKHKGPVPDLDRVLAGLFRTSTRKARALVDALIQAGKVFVEDGKIWNERARSDLVHRGFVSVSRAESGAKGGRTRAERAANHLNGNDQGQAIASIREEKRREEKSSVAKATGADAPSQPVSDDPVKAVFDAGIAILTAAGHSERAARSFLGKLRSVRTDADIFTALSECRAQNIVNPAAWLTERLKPPTPPPSITFDLSKFNPEGTQ